MDQDCLWSPHHADNAIESLILLNLESWSLIHFIQKKMKVEREKNENREKEIAEVLT